MKWKCTRRQLIGGFFGLTAGAAAVAHLGLFRVKSTSTSASTPPIFSASEERALLSVLDHLLPGVVAAGASAFMTYWFSHDRLLATFINEFKHAAFLLDSRARARHGHLFCKCNQEEKDELIHDLREGRIQARGFSGSVALQHLMMVAIESFLGDPKYGGNQNQVGWRFIGFKPCWWTGHIRQKNSLVKHGSASSSSYGVE